MDKLYGEVNDAIAYFRKNTNQVKVYYRKRKREKENKFKVSEKDTTTTSETKKEKTNHHLSKITSKNN